MSAQTAPDADADDDGVALEDTDRRTARALTERMIVMADASVVSDAPAGAADDPAQYAVIGANGSDYVVDTRAEACTCPDSQHRGATCKHQRRVAFATGEATVPEWADEDAVDRFVGEVSDRRVD